MRWQVKKRNQVFIKYNVTRNINVICGNVETVVALMLRTIPKKNTLFRAKLKFAMVVWMKVRPTRTTKHFEERIVRNFLKKELKWCFHLEDMSGEPINQETSCEEGITPKLKGHRCMSKKSKTSFNQVTVFALSNTVLLMCMWTRHVMRDPKLLKERIEVAILASPIRLYMNNFMLEKTLNMRLKLQENIKHITFTLKQIKPSKAIIGINETDIIVMTTH